MKIGIPRGLLYYKYYPLWHRFFSELGMETVSSPRTNRTILANGLNTAESEICLPVKAYYGHVAAVKDRVDFVFVPRIVAVEGSAYTCPKLLGLPDMLKSAFPDIKLLSPDINLKKGLRRYYLSLYNLARQLGASASKAVKAIVDAEMAQSRYHEKLMKGLTVDEALSGRTAPSTDGEITIGIAGHSYNVFDTYLSLDLVKKLKKRNVRVLTPENVARHVWERYAARLPKYLFWTYEKELLGAALYWMEKKIADGIIYVLSFACGPDSIVQYVLENEAEKYGTPIMPLVLDEHSAEAGVLTRIEAFIDMLTRKKK